MNVTDHKVICLESAALYQLVEEIVERLSNQQPPESDSWINDKQAMKMLGITSRTTLQKFRDEGSIRFTQPSRRVILYDRQSILEFLDLKAKDTF